MSPRVVRVPKAPEASPEQDPPLTVERQAELLVWREAESRLPLNQQTAIDVAKIKTEREAVTYIHEIRAKLLPVPPMGFSSSSSRQAAWVLPVGAFFGLLTFLALAGLVFGKPISPESRVLVVFLVATGISLSAGFLGGTASASGKLPLPGGLGPVSFGATSGIAVFIVVFLVGYFGYARTGSDSVILAGTVVDQDTKRGIPRATIVIGTDSNIFERQATDGGEFRISDIPNLFDQQIVVSAKAENYKPAESQSILVSSYVQHFRLEMLSCYNGIWFEVGNNKHIPWEFKVSGTALHIYRNDGAGSGLLRRKLDGGWSGEVISSIGGKPQQITLNAPETECTRIVGTNSLIFERRISGEQLH